MAVIETSKMDNGLTLASVGMATSNSVSLGVWVGAGARDERSQEVGVAHFLEHMAFKGTQSRTALSIAKDIEDVGGFINAHTAREETAYYINLLPEHLEMGFEILSDILLNSTLPVEEIERERGVIIQEIGQSIDAPDDYVFECFSRACYGQHTLGNSILGTTDSVSGFTAPELAGFMQRYYGAEQMVICAAGPITHQQLSGLSSQYFDKLKQADAPQRVAPEFLSTRHIASRDLEQCHTVFGFQAPDARSRWRYPLMVLSNLYGGGMSSRLFQQVREERGLCYSIFSFAQMFTDTGLFGVYAGTSDKDVDEMLEVSLAALKACRTELNQEEIDRSKQQLRAAVLMRRDSVSSMMDTTARHLALFDRVFECEEMLAAIEKVSRADVAELAHLITSGPAPSLSIVGPANSQIDIQDMQAILA